MQEDIVKKILSGIGDLPSVPTAVNRVIALSRDPNVSSEALQQAIAKDPALSARVLRFANCPFLGKSNRITTLSHAIVMLGYRRIEGLAVAALSYSMCHMVGENKTRWATRLWEHSLATAIAGRALAHALGTGMEEECFTAGLLHDLGKAVILARLPQAVGKLTGRPRTSGLRSIEMEGRILGFTHEDVVRKLLKIWKFEPILVNAAGYHHHPAEAPDHGIFAYVVCAASVVATAKGFAIPGWSEGILPSDLEGVFPPISAEATAEAGTAIERSQEELSALR